MTKFHRPRIDSQVKSIFATTLRDFYILCYDGGIGAFQYTGDVCFSSFFTEDKRAIKLALINSGSRDDFLTNLRKIVPLLKKDVITDHYGWSYR